MTGHIVYCERAVRLLDRTACALAKKMDPFS
jgi:hypothetical protein